MCRKLTRVAVGFVALFVSMPTIACGGWYLMEPPSVTTSADRLFLREPLTHWSVLASFDHAADCEKTRTSLRHHDKGRRADIYPVCIATNDPRLTRLALPVGGLVIFGPLGLCPAFRQMERPARTLGR
jgi:hypothetical protein